MENLQELKIALEAEKNKNRILEEKLRMKNFENEVIVVNLYRKGKCT